MTRGSADLHPVRDPAGASEPTAHTARKRNRAELEYSHAHWSPSRTSRGDTRRRDTGDGPTTGRTRVRRARRVGGRGTLRLRRRGVRGGRGADRHGRGGVGRRHRLPGQRPVDGRGGQAEGRRHPDLHARAGPQPRTGRGARGETDHGAGDGRGAAHQPRPVAGRALVHGQHRRLPRGGRGRPRVRPLLHRPGDRRGQGAAGQGARRRRGRGRSGRDRRGLVAGRGGARDRPPPGGGRSGEIAGRRVPPGGGRGGGAAVVRRLCEGHLGPLQRGRGEALLRAGRGRRHHHHHGADPRAPGTAADHGRRRGEHEAGLGDRRHGRRHGRQCRGQRTRAADRHRQRRDHPRLHRPRRPAAHPGLAVVRDQPGQPDEAAHPGQGRQDRARPGRRRAARHHRGQGRREVVAAAARAGLGGARRRAGAGPRGTRQGGEGADERRHQGRPDPDRHPRLRPGGRLRPGAAAAALHRADARDRHRLLRDRQGPPRPAHPADERHQRHLRRRRRGRAAEGVVPRPPHAGTRRPRRPARLHQHLRWLRGDPPHARHVQQGELTT
ncbi:hypothetical protein SGPA1_12619 [Streptomyces misionensis JCM 4497]